MADSTSRDDPYVVISSSTSTSCSSNTYSHNSEHSNANSTPRCSTIKRELRRYLNTGRQEMMETTTHHDGTQLPSMFGGSTFGLGGMFSSLFGADADANQSSPTPTLPLPPSSWFGSDSGGEEHPEELIGELFRTFFSSVPELSRSFPPMPSPPSQQTPPPPQKHQDAYAAFRNDFEET
ncbi:hypothetical protein NFJ02_01g39430 [Pycnococcus provasolii]